MDSALAVAARAYPGRTRYVADPTMRGHWFVRDSGLRDRVGRCCYDVAHTARADNVVVLSEPTDVGRAARVANALNALDGNSDAPIFDEQTGEARPR